MFSNRQYKEVAGILLILISIILLLSLISFNTGDIKLLAESKSVKNIIGPFGAYFGNFLRSTFGYLSFISVIIFAIAGLNILRKGFNSGLIEHVFSLLFLMITGSAMISIIYQDAVPHFSGGYIGLFLAKLFSAILGRIGAIIVLAILIIIGFIFLGILSVSAIISQLDNRDEKMSVTVKKLFKRIFFINNKNKIPLNDLESVIERKGKKPPWIMKKRIIISDNKLKLPGVEPEKINTNTQDVEYKSIQLIEHREYTDDNDFISKEEPVLKVLEYNNSEYNDAAFSSDVLQDPEDEIHFTDYTDENQTSQIETNRIKSVILEHDVQPAEIIDELDYDDTDEQEYDNDGYTAEEFQYDGNINDDEKPIFYVPKVFDEYVLNEEYYVPTDFLILSSPIDAVSWKAEARKNSELLVALSLGT